MSKILFVKRSSSILAAACCVLYSNSSCEGAKGHSKLPECDVPACSSTINSLNQAMLGARKRNPATGSSDVIEAAVSGAGNSSDILTGCPIDINVLGASTWNLIHTIAEHIPEEPSDEERDRIESFMTNLAFLYPCHVCRVSRTLVWCCPYFIDLLYCYLREFNCLFRRIFGAT